MAASASKKKTESEAEFFAAERSGAERGLGTSQISNGTKKPKTRVNELYEFIQHYGGEIISGMISDPVARRRTRHGISRQRASARADEWRGL